MIKMESIKIPSRIIEQIREVAKYAFECDDWVTVKKEIMKGCPSNLRSLFSKRDSITKEQIPNNFDRVVMDEFEKITGTKLIVRPLAERRSLFS